MANVDREMTTRQIRDGVDIVDLVGGYVTLKRAGANFKGLCPFHQEKTPSFNVHPARQSFKCFGCGAGGDVFTFVQLRENVNFVEARQMLADRAGISLEHEERASAGQAGGTGGDRITKSELARVNDWAQRCFRRNYENEAGQVARQYVEKRGISPEMVEAFGLGFAVDSFDSLLRQAGQSRVDMKLLVAAGLVKERQQGGYYDAFRNRLMFPIIDVTGRVIGFGGRALGDDPAKYLNTPATLLFDKGAELFGLDRARQAISEKGVAVVSEGYTDCLMAHQFGITEMVATLGTAMTDAHAAVLKRYADRLILIFDSDEAGQRAADRALSVTLNVGLDVSIARVPDGKDPCDYLLSAGADAFNAVLKGAVGALESKWQQVVREYDAGNSTPARHRAVEAYLSQLAEWAGGNAIDPIQQGLLLNQLGKILSVPGEEVHRELNRLRKRQTRRPAGGVAGEAVAGKDTSLDNGGSRPSSAQQQALHQIVEVLLNAPRYYATVKERFDPSAIDDPAVQTIALVMVEWLDARDVESAESEEFDLSVLLDRLETPAYARLVTDLQARGERRGRFDMVIDGALRRIEGDQRSRQAAMLAEEIRSERQISPTDADETVPVGEDDRLIALAANAKQPHFAGPRARKRFLGA